MAGDIGIGKLIGKYEDRQRDAIHVAVAPVIAGQSFSPGDRVALDEFGHAQHATPGASLGVVDPYLTMGPRSGERFYLFLNPGSITSLRHDWTHEAFDLHAPAPAPAPAPPPPPSYTSAEALEWIRNWSDASNGPGFERLIAALTDQPHSGTYDDAYSNEGEYLHFSGVDASGEIPDELWDKVEVLTGRKVPESRRAKYFSCGC